ncbi:hypothetical protein BKA62DRAFT_367780 [Auriculariales sp. MPI-PUGE-AT-0066]|nr:hypothetical protein BKA62DRAFT_367780 [Auriculariales sp. MPI-PUGE-AT-0066]
MLAGNPDADGSISPQRRQISLLDLPVELFDLIIALLSVLPLDLNFSAIRNLYALSNPYHGFQDRTNVLRALSQACQRLRTLCIPLLWERLDLVFVPWADKSLRDREVALRFTTIISTRKLNDMSSEMTLNAKYIMHLSIALPYYDYASKFYEALAAAVVAMPALVSLQVVTGDWQKMNADECHDLRAIDWTRVHTLSAGSGAAPIMSLFQHVRRVVMTGINNPRDMEMLKSFVRVERLEGSGLWSRHASVNEYNAKDVLAIAGKLKHLELVANSDNGYIDFLAALNTLHAFKELQTLVLTLNEHLRLIKSIPTSKQELDDAYASTLSVTRAFMEDRREAEGRRKLVVRYIEWADYRSGFDPGRILYETVTMFD